jgi:hypothetical protein
MNKLLFALILFSNFSLAKEYTKPPSVALRTEASYVTSVVLNSKKKFNDEVKLKFLLIKNLYNESDKNIDIIVSNEFAKSLETNVNYIIAYEKLRQVKVNGLKKYIKIENGPRLIDVEGASPALFRNNELLVQQLTNSPEIAKSDPNILIETIFNGIDQKDPKIKEFFVREIINWSQIHTHLSKQNYQTLFNVLISADSTVNMKIAVLEGRTELHANIGIEKISNIVLNLLNNFPVQLDAFSDNPTLILEALNFVKANKLQSWDTIRRWTRSNIPTISEKALNILDTIDSNKTQAFIKHLIFETSLSEPTRRVIKRYIDKNY